MSVRIKVDKWRKIHLSVAELIDAWRVVPRLLVGGYSWLVYKVAVWYMNLHPRMIEGCVSDNIKDCIFEAPTTQHAVLITAVVGVSAAIFAFYTNTGKKWNGFTNWETPEEQKDETELTSRKVVTESVYRPDESSDGG